MSSPRIEIICVGTELLTGKVNTHAAYFGRKLGEIGFSIAREHTVGDDEGTMSELFSEAFRRADIVLCAGGLGPTFDDITRDVWSKVLRRPLSENPALVRDIEKKFRSRGFPMPPTNRRQAHVLKGAEPITNPNGTAPGQFLKAGKKILALLPGPTREMVPMFEKDIVPRLRRGYSKTHLKTKIYLIVGAPESHIDQLIRPFVERFGTFEGCRITHGILASQSVVSVKFTVEGRSKSIVQRVVRTLSREAGLLLKPYVFGEDEATLEGVIGNLLRGRRQTVACAESCSGGLIAKMLTDQSGSSDFFVEGVVSYRNDSKRRRLGVKKATLAKEGAVSHEVAKQMAEGLRRAAKTTYALSVTGIAGPTGGSKQKPVGLVYIGCAGPKRTLVKEFHFSGERAWIRHRSAMMALDLLRRELIG